MHDDRFRLEARRLIKRKIADRSERMAAVDALIDIYVESNGAAPDGEITEELTDYVLREEITDKSTHKMAREEYPILSDKQERRRVGGRTGRAKSNTVGEVPLEFVSDVASDSVHVIFYDTDDMRLQHEIDRETRKYAEINRRQPVFTRPMTQEERDRILPHVYADRGKEHAEWSLDVRRRDGFTCQKCGKRSSKGMHAHHIEAYNTAIDLRHDMGNGITLCPRCHHDFHAIYGRGGNNRSQLDEWMGDSYYEL